MPKKKKENKNKSQNVLEIIIFIVLLSTLKISKLYLNSYLIVSHSSMLVYISYYYSFTYLSPVFVYADSHFLKHSGLHSFQRLFTQFNNPNNHMLPTLCTFTSVWPTQISQHYNKYYYYYLFVCLSYLLVFCIFEIWHLKQSQQFCIF